MKIKQKLSLLKDGHSPSIILECFVPDEEEAQVALRSRMERMSTLEIICAFDILGFGNVRIAQSAFKLASYSRKYMGVSGAAHISWSSHTRTEIISLLRDAEKSGDRNVIFESDDDSSMISVVDYYKSLKDVLIDIRSNFGDFFSIGIRGYPVGNNPYGNTEKEFQTIVEYQDLGVDYIICQHVLSASSFLDYRKAAVEKGITIPIIPSIFPVYSVENFIAINNHCGISLPEQLDSILSDRSIPLTDRDILLEKFTLELCQNLQQSNIPSLHIVTMNLEAPVIKLLSSLGLSSAATIATQRKLPWRATADESRATEEMRPIYWANRPAAYVDRTSHWSSFPAGKWKTAMNSQPLSFGSIRNSSSSSLNQGSYSITGISPQYYNSHGQTSSGGGLSNNAMIPDSCMSVSSIDSALSPLPNQNSNQPHIPSNLNPNFSSSSSQLLSASNMDSNGTGAPGSSSSNNANINPSLYTFSPVVMIPDLIEPFASSVDGVAERRRLWGTNPTEPKHVFQVFCSYVSGQIPRLPWCEQALLPETSTIMPELVQLNREGFLTINSQPRVNGICSDDATFGWGGPGGLVYQKAYIEFFCSLENLFFLSLVLRLPRHRLISISAANFLGVTLSSRSLSQASAVTWGVFPDSEIQQTTIVEHGAFLAWKEEAFFLWKKLWVDLYEEGSESHDLMLSLHDKYFLVSLVDNDFVNGDIFQVFHDAVSLKAFASRLKGSGGAAGTQFNGIDLSFLAKNDIDIDNITENDIANVAAENGWFYQGDVGLTL